MAPPGFSFIISNLSGLILFNKYGSSFIEIIISVAVMSIISLGFATMMTDQNRQVNALEQKFLSKELETQMQGMFSNSDYCNCAFRNKTFDMTAAPPMIAAADQFTRLVNGYSAPPPACTVVAGNFIPPVGLAVAGSTLTIGSIGLGGLTQLSPGVYKADLRVSFNGSIRNFKPIQTSVQFSINMAGGTPAARPFAACGGASGFTGIKNKTTITIGEPVDDQLLGNFHLCIHGAYRGATTQGGDQIIWTVGAQQADGRYAWHGKNRGAGGDWIPFFDVICFDY